MLKGDRQIDANELGYYMNETATRGVIVCVSTASSGANLDGTTNVATVAAASSGQLPLGMLLDDVVNLDLTRTPVNWHKSQINQGGKVSIMTKGWVVTNNAISPTAGRKAVLASSGFVMNGAVDGTHNEVANPTVGRFRSNADEEGYVRLYVDL